MNAGKKCHTGVFCSQVIPELPEKFDTSLDKSYPIPMSDDNLMFYYDESYQLHFSIPQFKNQSNFAQVHTFFDGGGGISFHYNNSERIFISMVGGQTTYVDINLFDMKPIPEDTKADAKYDPDDIPADFIFKSAEYWVLKSPDSKSDTGAKAKGNQKNQVNLLSNLLWPQWYNSTHPLNYFRSLPVYSIPASLTIEKMSDIMLKGENVEIVSKLTGEKLKKSTPILELFEYVNEQQESNGVIDLEFDPSEFIKASQQKQLGKIDSTESANTKYLPIMKIFDKF